MRQPLFVLPLSLLCALTAQTPPHRLFDAPVLQPGLAEEMELLGDVDNDGDVDAIAFDYVGTSVLKTSFRPLLNNGNGVFAQGTSVAIPPEAGHYVHSADVDGNGFLDVLVATSINHSAGPGVLVYRGLGGGSFAAPLHVSLPGQPLALGSGNANGDGIADVLVVHVAGTARQARWLLGGPALTFPSGPTSSLPISFVATAVVLDLDGDGVSDFAALTDAGTAMVASLFRTTPGGFVAYGTLPAASTFANVMVGADVDGDGDQDLLVASIPAVNTVHVVTLANQGASGFTSTTQVLAGAAIYVLAPGDWDGDGDADFVARGGTSATLNPFFQVTVFENAGGSFAARRFDTLPGDPVGPGAGCADLDRDGNLDYVGGSAVLFGAGTTLREARPYTVFPDDWDGDGDLDHLMPPELRLNDGRGVFTTLAAFWPPSPGANLFYLDPVAKGDFDGDGLRELLVPLVFQVFPTSQQFVEMRRLEADGDGQLTDLGAAAVPAAAITPPGVVDDADGDGDLDLVTRQGVWQNNGSAFFTLLPQAFQNYQPVAKADVDLDGDQDLLAVSWGVPGTAIFYRTAPATYSVTVLLAPTTAMLESTPALFADLDDDGDPDVITKERVNAGLARTATFVNNGGVFTTGPVIAAIGNLAAADFDGDGRTDVCVQESDRLHLVPRVGPGPVYASTIVFASRGMTGAADLDQDGDVDLLGNPTTWNRRFVMPAAGERRQYGLGSAGTGGRRPLLSMVGPLRAGLVPSARLVGGLGGSFAVLFASTSEAFVPAALPGVTAYIGAPLVGLGVLLGGAAGQPGAGGFEMPIAIPPAALGAQLFLQCLALDPMAPMGLTHSNGCEMRVGQ